MAASLDIPLDLHWLETTALASVRIAAFLVLAPPFSDRAFPGMVKAALSLGLAVAVAPALAQATPELDDAEFLVALALQALIGAAFGFLVYLVFSAVQSAGGLIDLTSGFQLAAAYDPQLAVNGAQFTRLFQMAALALMCSSGAYQVILAGLAGTFRALPIGHGFPAGLTAELVVRHASAMFAAAAEIAGPLIVVLFLADLGLGLLTKVAPALNAFSMSYPVKILLALGLGSGVFLALPAAVQSLTGSAVDVLTGAG